MRQVWGHCPLQGPVWYIQPYSGTWVSHRWFLELIRVSRGSQGAGLMSLTFPLFTVGFLVPGFVYISTCFAANVPREITFGSPKFWTVVIVWVSVDNPSLRYWYCQCKICPCFSVTNGCWCNSHRKRDYFWPSCQLDWSRPFLTCRNCWHHFPNFLWHSHRGGIYDFHTCLFLSGKEISEAGVLWKSYNQGERCIGYIPSCMKLQVLNVGRFNYWMTWFRNSALNLPLFKLWWHLCFWEPNAPDILRAIVLWSWYNL